MTPSQLAAWQWTDYKLFHAARLNLIIHIVAVPVFLLANAALVCTLWQGAWTNALISALVMLASFAAQAIGHGKEANPSIPFASPTNAVARIFTEQWVTFPRFVLSGGWWRGVRGK